MTASEAPTRWRKAILHPWTIAAISLVFGIAGTIVTTRIMEAELRLASGGGDRFSPTDETMERLAEKVEPGKSAVVEIAFFPPPALTFHGLEVISAGGSKTVRLFAGHRIRTVSTGS